MLTVTNSGALTVETLRMSHINQNALYGRKNFLTHASN